MRKYLLSLHGIWKPVLVFDGLLVVAAGLYCGLSPVPLELEPGSGLFLFLGLLAIAFCQARILHNNRSAFTLAARLPFAYDRFFALFLALFSAPMLSVFVVFIPCWGFRAWQSLFALLMIKAMAVHLFILFHRNAGWFAAYFTVLLAGLFTLKLFWDVYPYPEALFAFLYLGFQVFLVVFSVRRGFHRPL